MINNRNVPSVNHFTLVVWQQPVGIMYDQMMKGSIIET